MKLNDDPDQDQSPSEANRYQKDIGKKVWFNWGRGVHHGILMKWDPAFQKATVEMLYMGDVVMMELKVGRTTGFGVVQGSARQPSNSQGSPSSRSQSSESSSNDKTRKKNTKPRSGGA